MERESLPEYQVHLRLDARKIIIPSKNIARLLIKNMVEYQVKGHGFDYCHN